MRAATEWNVPSHGIPSMAPPLIRATRSFISRAALLVKVTLKIWLGHDLRVAIRCASRAVRAAVLPVPAPASTSTGPSVVSTACRCGGFRPRRYAGSLAPLSRGAGDSGTFKEVSGRERNGNRRAADPAIRERFLRLLPISPLSTGLSTYFSLPRLGGRVHCHQVIGTAVPASLGKLATV